MKRSRLYLLLFLLALLAVPLAACGKTKTTPVTVPAPQPARAIPPKAGGTPAPPEEVPSCTAKQLAEIEAGHGQIGSCQPKPLPGPPPTEALSRGASGPDVSNNDPFFNWHPVKAHGHPFAYDKIIQGVRFIDSTAVGMANAQRAAGIIPGGYDFLEVCRTSASAEARLYASRLRAIGLTGLGHAFVPMGDAEWPLSVPCSAASARAWLLQWENTLHAQIGRWPGFYTGAWWWDPNVGCWRPPHAVRWVSGYTSRRRLPIPCGWGGVDLWQYTSNGFNGVSNTDMSVLETSVSVFVGSTPPRPVPHRSKAERRRLIAYWTAARRRELARYHRAHCGPHSMGPKCRGWRAREHELLLNIRRVSR